ncbi:MAG: DUF192 domain-containing protein [Kiritimatiellae bacterium]|nr:DUF192 domain-containing protein [Kiritimatiellia bacterium]
MKEYELQFEDKKWQCDYAATFFERGWGLLGRKSYPANRIMVIPKCGSVHTWFMRFNIDIVFLDRCGKVLRVEYNVSPWRMLSGGRGACTTLEAMSSRDGSVSGFFNLKIGDYVHLIEMKS